MAEPCRFDAHVALCGAIVGSDASVPVCDQPVAYTAIVRIEPVDGVSLRIDSDVCEGHNRRLATAPHYHRSIKLRSRPGAAATSPAAGS